MLSNATLAVLAAASVRGSLGRHRVAEDGRTRPSGLSVSVQCCWR